MSPPNDNHPVTVAERRLLAALERAEARKARELAERRKREDDAIAAQIPRLPW